MMNETKQSAVMSILSSPDFKWTSEEVLSVSDQFPTLKLLFDSNLSRMWTFLKAMQEAVELGVAETGSRDRLKNPTLVDIRSRREHVKPTANDIGVSRHSDLASFSLYVMPNESKEDHFSRLCLSRARGGPLCVPIALDLEMTPLQFQVLQPTVSELTVGNLLKEANTHRGAKLGLRRQNLLGEIDGLCRVTNTDTRVDKLCQALQLAATMEALGKLKEDEGQLKKASKAAAAAATAARKKKVEEKQAAEKHELFQLTPVLEAGPVIRVKSTVHWS
jgi:hypothetical protein